MVRIRLSRGGRKARPCYSIVAADQRAPRDGKCLERLGYYHPLTTGSENPLQFDVDRATTLLANGAQMTPRVQQLYRRAKRAAASASAE